MNKKSILVLLCALAIVAASVFGTLAYLTDSEAVTNTFTVGQVGIKLDEEKVNTDGTPVTPAERTEDGNEYHLLPGHIYTKDPTVTMDADSEDAYVRMMVKVERIDQLKAALPKVDSEGKEIEANKKYYNGDLFLLQMLCNEWDGTTWVYEGYTQAEGSTTGAYEFRYKEIVEKADDDKLPALFKSITVPGEIDNAGIANLADVKINVTAHAIQAGGFDDADDAWAAFTTQQTANPNA